MTTVAQIGNFRPEYSTENELKRAFESLDVEVISFQENSPSIFNTVVSSSPDLIVWTRTRWQPEVPHDEQFFMLVNAKEKGIPVVGYHLDRWHGLNREPELLTEPFFKVDTLYTADGGPHDWGEINHRWLPPAVDAAQCIRGTPRDEFRSELAFIGSWDGGYHKEHKHRMELIHWLATTFGERIKFWPQVGGRHIRGKDLQDLIASTDVIVGDSCFTGTDHYWSDRIPETLGRAGYLIHPYVEGLEEQFNIHEDLATWQPGNWQQLKIAIEYALANPDHRDLVRLHGMKTVKENHTYRNRMAYVLADQKVWPKRTGGFIDSQTYIVGERGPELFEEK